MLEVQLILENVEFETDKDGIRTITDADFGGIELVDDEDTS
jgi:hypothetical protein